MPYIRRGSTSLYLLLVSSLVVILLSTHRCYAAGQDRRVESATIGSVRSSTTLGPVEWLLHRTFTFLLLYTLGRLIYQARQQPIVFCRERAALNPLLSLPPSDLFTLQEFKLILILIGIRQGNTYRFDREPVLSDHLIERCIDRFTSNKSTSAHISYIREVVTAFDQILPSSQEDSRWAFAKPLYLCLWLTCTMPALRSHLLLSP